MKTLEPNISVQALRRLTVMPVWHPDPGVASLGSALGIGRSKAYALAQAGAFPTIQVGARVLIPVPAFLRAIGDTPEGPNSADIVPDQIGTA